MKTRKLIITSVLFCAAVLTVFDLFYIRSVNKNFTDRNVFFNRINNQIDIYISENKITYLQSDKINDRIAQINKNKSAFEESRLSSGVVPDCVSFISISDTEKAESLQTDNREYIFQIRDCDEAIAGFIVYKYKSSISDTGFVAANIAIILCLIFVMSVVIYLSCTITGPLKKLVEYPAQLSQGYTEAKLPETKNKNFGKFIWGMNMLTDTLNSNKKLINKLECERQTLLTSIAHSVKTPVANIKLYAEAIQTGLYSQNKTAPEDIEIAEKIENNAEKIEKLTSELLQASSSSILAYSPQYSEFYLEELCETVKKQYCDKFKICRIPYIIECIDNPMLRSDKSGLMKIISQLIENAIKYGNGKGISIIMEKQDDFVCISVKNKGKLLPENELPFVFNSFWRGSNSHCTDGNGIGLYVSKKIARSIGGDLYIKRLPESEEMEFLIIVSL